MKYLTLIRHAKSDHGSGQIADRDRPLHARGRTDANLVGALLAATLPVPDHVLASPALRVRETLEGLETAGVPFPSGGAVFDEDLYLADSEEIADFAGSALMEYDEIWIVGHNPGLTGALELMSGARLENLPTLGVARIAFDEVAPTMPTGTIVFFDSPKNHRREE